MWKATRAPNGWSLNWLKNAAVPADVLSARDLGVAISLLAGCKSRAPGGGTHKCCQWYWSLLLGLPENRSQVRNNQVLGPLTPFPPPIFFSTDLHWSQKWSNSVPKWLNSANWLKIWSPGDVKIWVRIFSQTCEFYSTNDRESCFNH